VGGSGIEFGWIGSGCECNVEKIKWKTYVGREVGHPSVEDHQHQEEGLIIETNKQTRGIMRISFQTTKECKTKQKKKKNILQINPG
jgi:hypothetical protein